MRKYFLSILLLLICTTAFSDYRTEAEKLFNKEKYSEAGAYFIKCAQNEEIADKPRKSIILQCYKDASYCFYTVKNYTKALNFMEETLAWSKRNGNTKETAESYLNKGKILFKLNRYRDSLKCYEKALPLFKELDVATDTARCMNELSSMLILMEKFQKAGSLLERSMAIYKDGKNEGEIAETDNIYGDLFVAESKYLVAEKSYKKALKYHMELSDLEKAGMIYAKLGDLFLKKGDSDKAYSFYSMATVAYKEIKNTKSATLQLFNAARFFIEKKQTEKASEIFKPFIKRNKPKKVKRKKSIDPEIYYYALVGMGDVKKREKKHSKSIYYYLKAHDVTPSNISNEKKASLLIKMGEAFALSGNYENALALYEDANDKLSVYDGTVRKTSLLERMGGLAFSYKLYDSALNYFEIALRINRDNPVIKSLYLAKIGEIYFHKKDNYLSKKFLLDSTKIQENQLDRLTGIQKLKLLKSYRKANSFLYVLSSKKDINKGISYLQKSEDLPEQISIDDLKKIAGSTTILYFKTIYGIEDIFHKKPMTNFLLIIKSNEVKGFRIKTFETDRINFQLKKRKRKELTQQDKTDNISLLTSAYKKKDIEKNSKLKIILERTLYSVLIKPFEGELYGTRNITIIPSSPLKGLPFENLKRGDELFGSRVKIEYKVSLSSIFNKEKSKSVK